MIDTDSSELLGRVLVSFVKNYGLYWSREHVEWGKKGPGNAGRIRGYRAGSETPVDFRAQAGVYVLYDGVDIPSSRVTYVGQVGRANNDSLYARLWNHCWDHLWNRWTRFSWFGVYNVGKNDALVWTKVDKNVVAALPGVIDHLEGVLITILEPALNKRGANWDGAVQYFQHEPGAHDPVLARLAALEELVKKLPKG